MKKKDLDAINAMLPDGYVVNPKGGRPSKIARDVAVFLAVSWRMEMGDTPGAAESWVLETWRRAYLAGGWRRDGMSAEDARAMQAVWKKYGSGMADTAHVRSAARRARKGGLDFCLLCYGEGYVMAVECQKPPDPPDPTAPGLLLEVKKGGRSWHWFHGLPLAACGSLTGLKVELKKTPV